jgi:hypothetical protein
MRCSQIDLELHGGCERGYMFSLTTLDNILPRAVIEYLPQALAQISLRPIQAHAIVFSLFASLIAPFGGFYASAIKRAYKIKVWIIGFSFVAHELIEKNERCVLWYLLGL